MTEWYLKLCQRVYDLDQKAGIYMMFQIHEKVLVNRNTWDLSEAFPWSDTIQGSSFWYNLYNKLKGEY